MDRNICVAKLIRPMTIHHFGSIFDLDCTYTNTDFKINSYIVLKTDTLLLLLSCLKYYPWLGPCPVSVSRLVKQRVSNTHLTDLTIVNAEKSQTSW